MRILFVTHYYPPESNAPANRVSELAQEWVSLGHSVTVVTCVPSHPGGRPYPGYSNRIFQRERLGGVEVIRIGTFLAANQGVLRRSLNYLSFMLSVAANRHRLPPADVVLSTSPQFFAGIAGALVAAHLKAKWVFEVRDIWPESVAAVAAVRRAAPIRFLEAVERWAYRRSDQVVAVSPAFIDHISARGPLRRPVAVVENGVNLELFKATDGGELRERLGLSGKVVFGYIGTHGMAHRLETVLEAAALTRGRTDIAYLLVGSGAEREKLVELRERLELTNVVMLDHQPRDAMPAIWAAIDVSVVVLRKSPLFLRVIPSKMFEAMAMSRPMILGVDGQAREILEAGGCGLFVEPERSDLLAAAVIRLTDDQEERTRLGARGADHVRERYDRRALARRYLEILTRLATARSSVAEEGI